MKQQKPCFLIVLSLLCWIGFSMRVSAQTVVQWNLTASGAVSTVNANLTATAVSLNNVATSSASTPAGYGTTYGQATAPTAAGTSWNTTYDATKYLQFAVTANSGYELNVSSLSFKIGAYGGNTVSVAMYYSLNADFSNAQAIVPTSSPIGSAIIVAKNTLYTVTENLPTASLVLPGQTMYVRVYAWYNTTSARWLLLDNFAFQGTVTTAAPIIQPSVSSISGFSQISSAPSAVQLYTVSGQILTDDIVLKPSAGFQISSDSTTWIADTDSLTLTHSGSTLVGQPVKVFVRMNSSNQGVNTGTITHTSAGAVTVTVALTGTHSAVYYSNAAGDLTQVSSWDLDQTGTGSNPPANFTTDGQTFVIQNRLTSTLSSAWTVSGAGSKIVVGDGVNSTALTVTPAGSATGTLDVSANASLLLQGRIYPTFGTLNAVSTIVFDGADTLAIPAINFGNLSSTNDAGAVRILANSGTIGVAGTFSPGSAAYTITGSTVNFNGTTAQDIPTFTFNNLTVSNSSTIHSGNTITIGANATAVLIASGKTLTVDGTLVNNATGSMFTINGTLTFSSTGVYDLAAAATTQAVYIPAATWQTGSTAKITGLVGVAATDFTTLNGMKQTFSNFIVDAPNMIGKLVLTQNGSLVAPYFSVSGTMTVNSTGTGTGMQITKSGTQNDVTVGNYVQNGGKVYIAQNTSGAYTRNFSVTGNFILNNVAAFDVLNATALTTTNIANLNVAGNFSMSSTDTLTKSADASGTYYGVGTLVFNGTGDQNVSFGVVAGKLNIAVNKTSGNVILGSNLVAPNTFALTSGKVLLGNHTLLADNLNGGVTASYVVTDSIGTLKRTVTTTAVTFPVGTITSYNPVTMTNSGTVDTFAVRVSPIISNLPPDTTRMVYRQWAIHEETAGGSNAAITLQWSAGDAGNAFNASSWVVVGKDSNSTWIPYSVTTSGSGPYTATLSGVQDFSNYIVCNDSAFVSPITSIGSQAAIVPHVLLLNQNYPNPFNPTTRISFTLAESGYTTLKIFDVLGREVATLVNGDMKAGVVNTVTFNASTLSSGVYFSRLESGGKAQIKKLVLMK